MAVAPPPSSGTATPSSARRVRRGQPTIKLEEQRKPCNQVKIPPRKRYATDDDWRSHKDKIAGLYVRNRLQDVVTVMETQHQFFATARMYKARFKEWGIEKNVTAASVHKLCQKLEEAREWNPPTPDERGGNERVVLDVGDDLDVKRIQKYMKRKPAGLGKLRKVSKRSLEAIQAMSVDSGKGSSGRAKVSITVAKLKQYQQQSTPEPSPPTLSMEWPSGPELPSDVIGVLRTFIDNHFDCPYPFTSIPNPTCVRTAPSQWQPQGHHTQPNPGEPLASSFVQTSRHEEAMLDLVLKFRSAHTLLDDGMAREGMQIFNHCLESLAFCVQQAQNASPFDTRPATRSMLWALSVASEMMGDFKHSKEPAVQMLLQRMTTLCAAYQPTMAELTRRLSQIESSSERTAVLRLVRCSISETLFATAELEPAFEIYSKTVAIAESPLLPADKLQALQGISHDPLVLKSPVLHGWMETRVAFAFASVPEASSSFTESVGSYGATASPSWQAQGYSRVEQAVGIVATRVEVHKAAGNWQTAQELEGRYGSMVQAVWGYHENASQGSMTSPLIPIQQGGFNMGAPHVTLPMGHVIGEVSGVMPGWGGFQPHPQQQHQGHVSGQGEPSSRTAWNTGDAGQWQVDPDLGSGVVHVKYEGSY
jgi:hypothetical protein